MRPFYTCGDIHLHPETLDKVFKIVGDDKCIFLGDFHDKHGKDGDQLVLTTITSKYLKWIIENTDNPIIQSNHDLSYRFPTNVKYQGYGFTFKKWHAANRVLTPEHYKRLKLFHVENFGGKKFVFSHAGFHPNFLPFGEFNEDNLRRMEEIALERAEHTHLDNPLFDDMDGPLWIRWNKLPVTQGICNVVGHTICPKPLINQEGDYFNICCDCAHTFILKFFDNKICSVNINTGEETIIKNLEPLL